MNLASRNTIKELLGKDGIRPNKRLGQNFLVDETILKKTIEAAELETEDVVLEVGAGLGTLTVELGRRVLKVVAVEKDKRLIPILNDVAGDYKNIQVINNDILRIDLTNCLPMGELPRGWKLLGNIPYYLTSALIRKFLEIQNPPRMMLLMVQKEVAQRICAKPPNMSLLSVSVQFYAKPEIILYAPRSSFWPQPEVDSALLKITEIYTDKNRDIYRFFAAVKAGFSSPRKQLVNNLQKGLKISREEAKEWLEKAGIEPRRRAETLSVEEWKTLSPLY